MKRYLPLALAVLAAALLIVSGLGARAGLWHYRTGFTLMKYAAWLGIATTLVTIIYLVVPRLRAGNVAVLVIAVVIGVLVFYTPWSFQKKARSVPPIHDITTDTERPPEFVALLPARAGANNPPEYEGGEITTQQKEAYPDLAPVLLDVPPDAAFGRAHEAAKDMGWEIVAADAAAKRIEATATTTWFGFKDDVVIRVEPSAQGSRIDVRSKSRVGKSDVGANAARIRKFVSKLGS